MFVILEFFKLYPIVVWKQPSCCLIIILISGDIITMITVGAIASGGVHWLGWDVYYIMTQLLLRIWHSDPDT